MSELDAKTFGVIGGPEGHKTFTLVRASDGATTLRCACGTQCRNRDALARHHALYRLIAAVAPRGGQTLA